MTTERTTIRLAGIEYDDTVNGPGLRVSVFLQGCNFHCPGCHNPETWKLDGGKEVTPEQLIALIAKDRIARKITWSGGEATLQYRQLLPVVAHFDALGYEQMLFTGAELDELEPRIAAEPLFGQFLSYMSLLIIGRFKKDQRSLNVRFRGSTNQRVLKTYTEQGLVYLEDVTEAFDRGDY